MQKTPVSILQEMMVQKGKVPNYNLIYDGGGSHENTFTYEVSCEGLTAEGTGRCKKDAKHAAAKNMLEAIANRNAFPALLASPAPSPVRTPLPKPMPTPRILPPDEPFVNVIGELQELCAANELSGPVYKTISDEGPPHARVFTIQCIVSSFKEEGRATTKKQAKYDAARKMYTRLKDLIVSTNSSELQQYKIKKRNHEQSSADAKVIFSNAHYQKKEYLGVKIADYHQKLKASYDQETCEIIIDKLENFRCYIEETDVCEWNDPFEVLKEKLKPILPGSNIDAQKMEVEIEEGQYLVAICLNTTPEITQCHVGYDIDDMVKIAFIQIIEKLIILLM